MKRFLALSRRGWNTKYLEVRNGHLDLRPDGTGRIQIKVASGDQSHIQWADSVEIRESIPYYEKPEVIEFPLT